VNYGPEQLPKPILLATNRGCACARRPSEFAVIPADMRIAMDIPIARLEERRAAIYLTDELALITIHSDGERLTAKTGSGTQWGFTFPLAVF
jgi:hypothetical protein